MPKKDRTASNLELIGGALCLDFVNTISAHVGSGALEYLNSYEDLVVWCRHAGTLGDEEATNLLNHASRHPKRAAATLVQGIVLRETIYRVLITTMDGVEPTEEDVELLNTVLEQALSQLRIKPQQGVFEWTWSDGKELDRILWPIVRSAADLLTSEQLRWVGQCGREGCDWLFLDRSKNHSRRWCSMGMCGSRVKSRRYYHRRQEGGISTRYL
jgi:predicted RNA-binding Zn ribbon-like protein